MSANRDELADRLMEYICHALPVIDADVSAQRMIRENLIEMWESGRRMNFVIPLRDSDAAIIGSYEDEEAAIADALDDAVHANLFARENGAGR